LPKELRKISIEEFARRLRGTVGAADKRFAFFLGAGCSVSSGIPHAGTLVREVWLPRLRDFRAPSRKDLDTWACEILTKYDPQDPAASYGNVLDNLFFQSEERQREIESLCDGRFPAFGYAVLSGMVSLDGGVFNVVLTTNFDDLIADALYLFTTTRPLVIHHESLASYIRPTRTRPLIVKLHGDHRLSPQNTARETETIKNEIEAHVRTLLHDRGLIFMGYGGNDKGIQKMFEDLPLEALPLGVFWVGQSEPKGILRPWLESRNAIWVEKKDFDEYMLVLRDEFQIQHPDRARFDQVFEKYTETYKVLSARIESLPDTSPGVSALKEAVKRTDLSFPDWRAVSLEAQRVEYTDPDRAETTFNRGLEQFPQSNRLLADYAEFTRKIRRNLKRALELYERAIAINSTDRYIVSRFATFLYLFLRDNDRAESLYKRLIETDPKDSYALAWYATFLVDARNNRAEAKQFYQRALAADPGSTYALTQLGDLLEADGDLDRAEELLRRAATLAPSDPFVLAALANFLAYQRNDPEQGEMVFKRAVESGQNNSYALRCYAGFLASLRKDYDAAEEFFRRAIDADITDPGQMISYAEFLSNIRKNYDGAEEFFLKAIKLSPDDPTVVTPYVKFLREVRMDAQRAEELEKRIDKSSPTDNLSGGRDTPST
jgi:tetratricopeptide (TPR) repeat protein